MNHPLIFTSATTLAQKIRKKQVSATEVIDAYLARIETVNPILNAVVELNPRARAEAERADQLLAQNASLGPLHGVPITIKESFAVTGMHSTGGTLGRQHYISPQDATTVARLRAAGAIILGTTNTPELSLNFESDNLLYGRTNNPYALDRTPGGSTGGEAAIIAAGGSALGLGGDYGGSIRIPAHFCGLAGLRPTVGRCSYAGYFPPAGGARARMAQPGPLARTVADLGLMLPIIAGPDGRDHSVIPVPLTDLAAVDLKTLRVAMFTDNDIAPATPETVSAVKAAAQVLADAGAQITEDRPPGVEQTLNLFYGLNAMDGGAGLQRALQMVGTEQPHLATQFLLEAWKAQAASAAEYVGLWVRWDFWRNAMVGFMQHYDVVLSPVCATPAFSHGTAIHSFDNCSYVFTYSLNGSPAVVVRAGTSPEGLPIGVQIVPQHWREDVGLAVAKQIEAALGGWQKPNL